MLINVLLDIYSSDKKPNIQPHLACHLPFIACTRDTSRFEMSPVKNKAEENARLIAVTRDTSHFDKSLLNDKMAENMRLTAHVGDT